MEGKGSQTSGRAQPESWSVFNKHLPKMGRKEHLGQEESNVEGKGFEIYDRIIIYHWRDIG